MTFTQFGLLDLFGGESSASIPSVHFVGNQCVILFMDFICFHLLLFTFNKHHVLSPYGHNSLSPFPFFFPQFSIEETEVHIHSTLFHFYLTYSFMYLAPALG